MDTLLWYLFVCAMVMTSVLSAASVRAAVKAKGNKETTFWSLIGLASSWGSGVLIGMALIAY